MKLIRVTIAVQYNATEKKRRLRNGEYTPVFRYPRKGCQTTRSVRYYGNRFFHYTDLNNKINSNLTLSEILELVFLLIMEVPFKVVSYLTGRTQNLINDWFNMCREVCIQIVSVNNRGQLIGTDADSLQIDEEYFSGHRGRLLQGDRVAQSEDSNAEVENLRNHTLLLSVEIVKHYCQSFKGKCKLDQQFLLMSGRLIEI
ncbi:hypothetical protein ILUMI_05874 [Ignelater luminosus]|uniref:Uncharacterized protein n=1 Tax=Ignelater luminosus TaxID=2038154 RepID=A0A8K0GJP4_IGNLU|nr:hypothetical protein ILUMI_05874 [Ignelater luminosus]